MTQRELAKEGTVSPQIQQAAQAEDIAPELILQGLADGTTVLPANINHVSGGRGLASRLLLLAPPRAIGRGLRTKVNANIGTSPDFGSMDTELEKLRVAVEYGADAVMDLSTGPDIPGIRRAILANSPVPIGTVPVYQAAAQAMESRGAIVDMTADDLFAAIGEQAEDGVDFITVHCGITLSSLERLKRQRRVTDVVSRGGSFLIGWMLHNGKENPLYEQYDRLLEIARQYDVTLSLGDGMRPGSLADATDRAQIEELIVLGELVERAWEAGVQVMVEGPGHMSLDQIAANVQLEKKLCRGAPFYVLGPLVTDIGAGYDHITAAIGGTVAAAAGADFLCYVTPSEHLGLPDPEDVKVGVIASRLAGHAADIVKGVKGAAEQDLQMARARKRLDWEAQARLSLDPKHSREAHSQHKTESGACSMCGKFCAMDLMEKYLGVTANRC
ncbi:MAG: phosphomethylpyrimidine synthase ThiC [Chloroflexi bacterium]|nr:phosphomethylpyrimidine synthase ThiC [Chloroflexota bacterium]